MGFKTGMQRGDKHYRDTETVYSKHSRLLLVLLLGGGRNHKFMHLGTKKWIITPTNAHC